MIPGAEAVVLRRDHISYYYIVKMLYFFTTLEHREDKKKDIGMICQHCKFHDPQSRDFCARVRLHKPYSENTIFH